MCPSTYIQSNRNLYFHILRSNQWLILKGKIKKGQILDALLYMYVGTCIYFKSEIYLMSVKTCTVKSQLLR